MALPRRLAASLLALLILGAGGVVLGPHARAEEAPGASGPRDFLSELKPRELEFLRTRIPGWERLEEAQRQRIAQNVIRLRNLGEAERQHFHRRLKHLTDAGGEGRGGLAPLERLKRDGTRLLAARGLGLLARRELGLDLERGLLARGVPDHAADLAFAELFWERAAAMAQAPKPEDLPAHLPAEARQRYAELHARHAGAEGPGRERLGRALGLAYILLRSEALRRAVTVTDPPHSEAYALALGERLKAAWPEAFAAAVGSVRENPAGFVQAAERHAVRSAVESLGRARGRLGRDELRVLVLLADRAASHNAAPRPEVRERVDRLVREILVGLLEIPVEAVDGLPDRSAPEAREEALRRLLRLAGPRRLR